jgi:hypothetical protein
MPDIHGFDHLPRNGAISLRCIWCGHEARPSSSEGALRKHARKHTKDASKAREEGERERQTAAMAISL